MPLVLTLDLGTTYVKAAVFDATGRLLHLRRTPPPVVHPHPGWMEMSPDAFRRSLRKVIGQLRQDSGQAWNRIAAVSFSTQTNSFLLLDKNDRPLTPIILWPDARAQRQTPRLEKLLALTNFTGRTGMPALSHQCMVAKLLWLQHQQRPIWKRMGRIALLSDYLTWWMTGQWFTEAGASGLTGLLDIKHTTWWPQACEQIGITPNQLSVPLRAGTDVGNLRPDTAEALGLPRTCRLIIGCLDQYAGAIGMGNTFPGGFSETTGTVLASVRCVDRLVQTPGAEIYQGPAHIPGRYWRMTFGDVSGRLLESYRASLPDRSRLEYAQLDAQAATVPPGCGGLRLSTAALQRGDWRHWPGKVQPTRGQIVRCIMEAVALALARQARQLCGSRRPREIRCTGGAANSAVWLQIKADLLGLPLLASRQPEATSAGAACLALARLGPHYAAAADATLAANLRRIKPNPANHAVYQGMFARPYPAISAPAKS